MANLYGALGAAGDSGGALTCTGASVNWWNGWRQRLWRLRRILPWPPCLIILLASDWGLFPVGDWLWGFPEPFAFQGNIFSPQPATAPAGLRRILGSIMSHALFG